MSSSARIELPAGVATALWVFAENPKAYLRAFDIGPFTQIRMYERDEMLKVLCTVPKVEGAAALATATDELALYRKEGR